MNALADARCPRCGLALPAGIAPHGLCPACLFATALATGDLPAEDSTDSASLPYRIVTPIDQDPAGVTYLAQSVAGFKRYVTLKIVGPCDDAASILERFQEWKPALSRVRHPGVGTVVEVGPAGAGQVYVASEYAAGSSWATFIARPSPGRSDRLRIACQLVDAVEAAHQHGVAHMKLDPSSVKIATAGDPQARILGFGYALIVEGATAEPETDVSALARFIQDLGVGLPHRPYRTAGAIRHALEAL